MSVIEDDFKELRSINHPEIPERYLEFVERMIKKTERNVGLEQVL